MEKLYQVFCQATHKKKFKKIKKKSDEKKFLGPYFNLGRDLEGALTVVEVDSIQKLVTLYSLTVSN